MGTTIKDTTTVTTSMFGRGSVSSTMVSMTKVTTLKPLTTTDRTAVATLGASGVKTKPKCAASVVDNFTVGMKLEVFVDFEANPHFGAKQFTAMLVEEESFVYVMQTMADQLQDKKPIVKLEEGQFVAAKKGDDGDCYRAFVLDAQQGELVLIDDGNVEKIALSDIYPLPDTAFDFRSLTLQFIAASEVSESIKQSIAGSENGTGHATIKEVVKSGGTTCQAVVAVNEALYTVRPWTKLDIRIPALLGIASAKLTLADITQERMAAGDEVGLLGFDETTNRVIIQSVKLAEGLLEVEQILHRELEERKNLVPIDNPAKGEVVACKWSESEVGGQFYRAVILSVDVGRKRVKVRFIDYGNSNIVSYGNLAVLPYDAKRFSPVAKVVKLSNVRSTPASNDKTKQQISRILRPLRVPLTLFNLDDIDAECPRAELRHPTGFSVSTIINEALSDSNVSSGFQCSFIGGGYEYDRCHVAELSSSAEPQTVVMLHVESPTEIFVMPKAQLSLAASLVESCSKYAETNPNMAGHMPGIGRVCLAKASDLYWYRAATVKAATKDDEMTMFFPDFGFHEDVTKSHIMPVTEELIKTPFMANHCVLDGFQDGKASNDSVSELLVSKLPVPAEKELIVTAKQDGFFVVRFPAIEKYLNEVSGEEGAAALEIKRLKEQLAALKMQQCQNKWCIII